MNCFAFDYLILDNDHNFYIIYTMHGTNAFHGTLFFTDTNRMNVESCLLHVTYVLIGYLSKMYM